ncbi:unnamed protein product [Closterium sp. NIES-53]
MELGTLRSLGLLELEALALVALELEELEQVALELEELELVALALEALELEALELEALAQEVLELEELELLTLELEVLEALCGHDLSPLPSPSPYTEQSSVLTKRREPASRPVSPVRTVCLVPRSHPPPVLGTHAMSPRLSSIPLRVPLLAPLESSLPESAAVSALVAELLGFAAACRLDYATALVGEFASACPPSVGGECALGTDVLEVHRHLRQRVRPYPPGKRACNPSLGSIGDHQWISDTPPHWDARSAHTGIRTRNLRSDTMVKRPPGSPPAFKARYVARGFSQRQGVDYFQTFSPTPKMTTLRVLLHVAAQRDYELHSMDFSAAFLQGSVRVR